MNALIIQKVNEVSYIRLHPSHIGNLDVLDLSFIV